MKEKRVDVYLAEAGWYVLVLIAFGSTFCNELVQDEPRVNIEVTTTKMMDYIKLLPMLALGIGFMWALGGLDDYIKKVRKLRKRRAKRRKILRAS